MGAGIAQACLAAGHQVTLHDARAAAPGEARERIDAGLARAAEKDRLGGRDPQALMAALTPRSGDVAEAVGDAEVVIEAIVEDPELKARAWAELGAAAPEGALLCTNTSSLSVTALAEASGRPERFCGLHFFNPVPVLPLVEVVRGETTPEATIAEAEAFAAGLGKTPVRCLDRPGFLVNRLLIPYLNEAAQLADEGAAEPEAIDTAMRLGAGVPMGPLALADLVGVDVVLAIMESLHAEFGDPRYRPAPLLRRMVRAGRLGRKSGRGFFDYGGEA
jgi:3-hydroxybutyryl-CoA dehydrogenase